MNINATDTANIVRVFLSTNANINTIDILITE